MPSNWKGNGCRGNSSRLVSRIVSRSGCRRKKKRSESLTTSRGGRMRVRLGGGASAEGPASWTRARELGGAAAAGGGAGGAKEKLLTAGGPVTSGTLTTAGAGMSTGSRRAAGDAMRGSIPGSTSTAGSARSADRSVAGCPWRMPSVAICHLVKRGKRRGFPGSTVGASGGGGRVPQSGGGGGVAVIDRPSRWPALRREVSASALPRARPGFARTARGGRRRRPAVRARRGARPWRRHRSRGR